MIFKIKKIILGCIFIFCFTQKPLAHLLPPVFSKQYYHPNTTVINGNRCDVDDLQIPNAFSPNNDGINDFFCLDGWQNCVDNFEILIFNRWAEVVFQSNKPDLCWDGSYKGKFLESNVFVFVIRAKSKDGIEFKKSGNVTLIR